MKTIVEAPPVKPPVNWYRLGARLLLLVIVAGLIASAIFAWPYAVVEDPMSTAVADGHAWYLLVVVFIGVFVQMVVGLAILVVAVWLAWRVLVGFAMFIEWWAGKVKETDRKHKKMVEYHD